MRGKATLAFDLSFPNLTSIDIYDLLGRRVMSVLNKEMGPGNHRISLDSSALASGIYICRLEAEQFVELVRSVDHRQRSRGHQATN